MKAIVRSAYGSPDVLRLADVDVPAIGDGDVLVRVRASSLNAADLDYLRGKPWLTRMGTGLRSPRNRGLGLDAAGTVEAVGHGVTRFRPGDEVFGDLTEFGYGAFAEYAAAPERAWAPMPAGTSFEVAATIPQAATLALQGLRWRSMRAGRADAAGSQVTAGMRVLVNGASGNVGPFAVQIAKSAGAHVTGVCSTAKMDLVRALGADEVVDYTREDVTRLGRRFEWILDVSGTRSLLAWRRALAPGGRYVMAGGPTPRILEALVTGPVISAAGSRTLGLLLWWKPFDPTDIAHLVGLLEAGAIVPAIDRTFPLAAVPDALRYLADGRARGKVVITI